MKVFKKSKRLLSLIVAAVMVLSVAMLPVSAAEYALAGTVNSVSFIMTGQATMDPTTTTGAITVSPPTGTQSMGGGATLSAYKLMDITNTNGALTAELTTAAQAIWDAYVGTTNATLFDVRNKLTNAADTDAKAIIDAFLANNTGLTAAATATTNANGVGQFTNLPLGLYVIQQTSAPAAGFVSSQPILAVLPMASDNNTPPTSWYTEYLVQPKEDPVSVAKTVKSASTGTAFVEEAPAQIGETVNFEVLVRLPEYGQSVNAVTFAISDTLPAGLTYNNDAAITFSTEDSTSPTTFNAVAAIDLDTAVAAGASYTFTFTDYLNDACGSTYKWAKITYTATLNGSAVVEGAGNTNTVELTYTNAPGTTETIEDTATVFTYNVELDKIDRDFPTQMLAGAEFEMYSGGAYDLDAAFQVALANGTVTKMGFIKTTSDAPGSTAQNPLYDYSYTVSTDTTDPNYTTTITIGASGNVIINGLTDTSYTLDEITMPAGGYQDPLRPFGKVFALDAANFDATANKYDTGYHVFTDSGAEVWAIENTTDIILPATGGIGTIVFTVVGLMLLAAGAFLVFKKKIV